MTPLEQFSDAISSDLIQLAVLHDRELTGTTLARLGETGFPDSLSFSLESEMAKEAGVLIGQALRDLGHQPATPELDELAADYAAIYLNHTLRSSPYESVWIDEDGLAMQEPMFQIRQWYQNYGFEVPDWRMRSDDHLVHQLDFLSRLFGPDSTVEHMLDACRFMDEHVLRWVEDFARRVASRAATPFYAGLNALTAAYLAELREMLSDVLDFERPSKEEIDQRMKPRHEAVVAMPQSYVPGASPSW